MTPSAMQDIPTCFIFGTDLLQMLESNTKIWSCLPPLHMLCGWHFVYQTDGRRFTWITCSTQRSCTRHCTGWRRWHMGSRAPSFHHPEGGEKYQSCQATSWNNDGCKAPALCCMPQSPGGEHVRYKGRAHSFNCCRVCSIDSERKGGLEQQNPEESNDEVSSTQRH